MDLLKLDPMLLKGRSSLWRLPYHWLNRAGSRERHRGRRLRGRRLVLFCNNMEAIHLDDERFLFMRPLLEEHDLALGVWIAGDELRHRPPTPVVVRLVNQAVNYHHIFHPDRL